MDKGKTILSYTVIIFSIMFFVAITTLSWVNIFWFTIFSILIIIEMIFSVLSLIHVKFPRGMWIAASIVSFLILGFSAFTYLQNSSVGISTNIIMNFYTVSTMFLVGIFGLINSSLHL